MCSIQLIKTFKDCGSVNVKDEYMLKEFISNELEKYLLQNNDRKSDKEQKVFLQYNTDAERGKSNCEVRILLDYESTRDNKDVNNFFDQFSELSDLLDNANSAKKQLFYDYVQSKVKYGIELYGFTSNKNIKAVQTKSSKYCTEKTGIHQQMSCTRNLIY